MEPDNPDFRFFCATMSAYNKLYEEAFSLYDLVISETPNTLYSWMSQFIKYAIKGDETKAIAAMTPELIKIATDELRYSWVIASGYSLLNMRDESLDWLERAVSLGWCDYPYFNKHDPFLENIRGEERFKKLMERVKHEWENFEV